MNPTLIILSGELAGERIELRPNKSYIIGRDDSADIVLPEKKISRRHASIRFDTTAKQLILEDLNSLNGTFVNGQPMMGATYIEKSDRIQIGSFLLEAEISEKGILTATEVSHGKHPRGKQPRGKQSLDEAYAEHTRKSDAKDILLEEDRGDSTGGMIISGKVEELSIPDLLQLLASTRKSGRLVVSRKKIYPSELSGENVDPHLVSIYLHEGKVVFAQYSNLENDPVIYHVIRWEKGYFALLPHEHFNFSNPMDTPIEALILEGLRKYDEEKARRPKLDEQSDLEIDLSEPITHLDKDQLVLLQLVWKHKRLKHVLHNSDLGRDTTLEALVNLLSLGYLRVASEK